MIRGFRAIGRAGAAVVLSAGLVVTTAMGASAMVTSEGAAKLISTPAAGATALVDTPAPPPVDLPTPAPEPPAPEPPVDTGLLDGLLATVTDTVAGLLSTLLGLLGGVAPV